MIREETEQKKYYLKGYERAVRQMERSYLRIQEIRAGKMYQNIIVDDMPHVPNQNDLSGYAALLDLEERKYLKCRYKRMKKCEEITDKIERLENEDEKDVLMYRYIKLLKWEDICVKMDKSWRQIHRFHSMALKNFKMA